MGRGGAGVAASLAAIALTAGLGWAGCGDGESFSDAKIQDALGLEPAGKAYTVGGDPFCEVSELLNDGDELADAPTDRVLASPDRNVGIVVGRTFAPDCERDVREDLDRLDPKEKE